MNWFLRMFGGKPKAVTPAVVPGSGPDVTATITYTVGDGHRGSSYTTCYANIVYSDGHSESVDKFVTTEHGVEYMRREITEKAEKRVRYYQDLKRNGTWTQEVT